jgi:hypothetical protein
MEVRGDVIYEEEKGEAREEACRGREDGPIAFVGSHLDAWDKQGPEGGGDHNSGGEAHEGFFYSGLDFFLHEEDKSGAYGCAQEGDEEGRYQDFEGFTVSM